MLYFFLRPFCPPLPPTQNKKPDFPLYFSHHKGKHTKRSFFFVLPKGKNSGEKMRAVVRRKQCWKRKRVSEQGRGGPPRYDDDDDDGVCARVSSWHFYSVSGVMQLGKAQVQAGKKRLFHNIISAESEIFFPDAKDAFEVRHKPQVLSISATNTIVLSFFLPSHHLVLALPHLNIASSRLHAAQTGGG